MHTYAVDWDSDTVALAVVGSKGKRMRLRFTLPAYAAMYHACATDSADLICKAGKWYLHIVVTLPNVEPVASTETVGVDLGINHPAVTSKRKFYGTAHWKEVDRRYFRIKRKLQSKGTKSALRHLRKLAGKQMRFHRDCDHVLSRRIVDSGVDGATIVIENLTNIRDKHLASVSTSFAGGRPSNRLSSQVTQVT